MDRTGFTRIWALKFLEASQITDEKLLIDIAKNSLSRDARTTAIRNIRENPNNEEELIYIVRNEPWYFNRRVAISYINDKSALNEMLKDSSIKQPYCT